jgi:spermidine synthase
MDEAQLARRIAVPAVAEDLRRVTMGSVTDFLSYFVMGTEGMARFSRDGVLNSDDRLYLEFSAPFSIASPSVMGANVRALGAYRESILAYLASASEASAREEQQRRWEAVHQAGVVRDRALALYLAGKTGDPQFSSAVAALGDQYPGYAPGRFLRGEYEAVRALAPRPIHAETFSVMSAGGAPATVEITAVLVPVSKTRAALMFVDNTARVVYAQIYVDDYEHGNTIDRIVTDAMTAARGVYDTQAQMTVAPRETLPQAAVILPKVGAAIRASVARQAPLR